MLQTELTPLKHNQARTHELSSYLMYSDPEDIARVTQTGHSNGASSAANRESHSRWQLMEKLQTYLPAAIMLPPRRLLTLLSQAAQFQTERCIYHNRASGSPVLDSTYLAVDHVCPKQDFPCETIQVVLIIFVIVLQTKAAINEFLVLLTVRALLLESRFLNSQLGY